MYHVKNWDTNEILSSHEKITVARFQARKLGHTGENDPGLKGYPPIAYVVNDHNFCIYNPRFKKGK